MTVKATRFTVSNYGGSNSRWSYSYTFNYSRRDRNWQLVRAVASTFHALDPEKTTKTKIYTPPKHFGLITFAEFEEDNFLSNGKR